MKIHRAERHLVELQAAISDFFSGRPFHAVVEAGKNPDRQRITFRVTKEVPKELSAIIGDVVHNLRASLDLLACELVRLNGQSDKDVHFPFCKKASELEAMIKKRRLHRAAPQAVGLIRSLKPYPGGNSALRAIHDLDIRDKHQTLIPIGDFAGFGNATFGGSSKISVPEGIHFGPVQDGFSPFEFSSDPALRVGQEIPANFKLTFSSLDPLGAAEIVPTLQSLVQLVTGVVEVFEALGLNKPSRSACKHEPPGG